MPGAYEIFQGDPRTHGRAALELALRNLQAPPEVTEARFPKYYEQNPAGAPLLFFAQHRETGAFVGMATLFPVELWMDGEVVRGGITGDLAVDKAHRGLGPALALQRAVLDALPAHGVRLAYGVPNRYSDPVAARLGCVEVGQVARFVKFLKLGPVARAAIKRPRIARLASALAPYTADPLFALLSRERLYRRRAGVRVEYAESFDERFLDLFAAMSQQHRVTTRRTPELLNWRYELGRPPRAGSDARSVLAISEDGGNVLGYVVHRTIDAVCYVEDVGFMSSRSVLDTLLAELVLAARRQRLDAISLTYLGPEGLLLQRLRAFGFVRRPELVRLRVFVPEGASLPADPVDQGNWYFLGGDSDV